MNNIWPIALCAVLLVGCASNFEQGVSAYKSGNYDLAAAMFNGPAQAGHAGSQNNLGLLWLNGYGSTPQNPEQALLWFSKAAQQGEPYAMTNIGHMYENGIFVPRNIRTAVGWYTLAARKGIPEAQATLVRLGEPVPPVDLAPQQAASNSSDDASLLVLLGLLAGSVALQPAPASSHSIKIDCTSRAVYGAETVRTHCE